MSKKTKEKFVVTINNEELPISKTRKYDSGFYKIGDVTVENSGDCYILDDGKCYRFETGVVLFDNYLKKYVHKASQPLYQGVVDVNLNIGYYSHNPNSCRIYLPDGKKKNCMDLNIFKSDYSFREKISDGNLYHISLISAKEFSRKEVPSQDYKTSLPYDSKDIGNHIFKNYDKTYKPSLELENVPIFNKILNGLTFGLEFETTKGFLPNRILDNLHLIPLRDGSITGIEYVTVPLEGEKGLYNLIENVKELNKRTEFNDKCALHLHLGNIPRTESFIMAFLRVTLAIQDELFSMFNLYKKYNFGYKNKNYSAPYNVFEFLNFMDSEINERNLRSNFNILFSHLSEGHTLEKYTPHGNLNEVISHHKDPTGNQKWNIRHRYHVHNLIPLIFGNKKTIEFRIHTPTYDINKIIWFLLFNSILVNFCKKFEKNILENKIPLDLRFIIDTMLDDKDIPSGMKKYFSDYLNIRKRTVEKFNFNSDIHFDEKEIKCNFNIFKNFQVISEKGSKISFEDPTNALEFLRSSSSNVVDAVFKTPGNNISEKVRNYQKLSLSIPESTPESFKYTSGSFGKLSFDDYNTFTLKSKPAIKRDSEYSDSLEKIVWYGTPKSVEPESEKTDIINGDEKEESSGW